MVRCQVERALQEKPDGTGRGTGCGTKYIVEEESEEIIGTLFD